ncbi:MAG TPA: DinB family protein [Candidatus Acidoferrales bacterium]|nr:DinB family protein [Candidatus Acidoferrales bacterium]
MNPAERESLLKNLAESRDRLVSTVRSLSPEQRHYRPAPDRWSFADIVEHLTSVESLILGMVQKSLEAPADSSKQCAMDDRALLTDVAGRITRFKAPEMLAPTGKFEDEELLPAFESARQRTCDFAQATGGDLRRHFAPHPVFGELDCYQWLMLLAAHCDRHRVQGEEVKAGAGFPRAAQTGAFA